MSDIIYRLPDLSFIAGSTKKIIFHCFNDEYTHSPVDMTGYTATYALTSFMNKSGEASLTGDVEVGGDTMSITFDAGDTINMFGKYVYQISIVGTNNDTLVLQGAAYIHRNIDRPHVQE